MTTPAFDPQQAVAQNRHRCAQLEREITALAAHMYAGTYRWLCLIREFDEREGWGGEGVMSCAHWLNWQCGIALGAAREKLRVAHALKGLPRISAAFAKGALSYSKVRAMTRVANVENEDYLLMIAEHGTAVHVETLVRAYRGLGRAEARERAMQQHENRHFMVYTNDHGALVFHGCMPAEQGALVMKALDAVLDTMFQETRDEAAQGVSTDVPAGTSEARAEPAPNMSQRRADALVRMAETVLAEGLKRTSNAQRYQVVVHVGADVLSDAAQRPCALESGPALGVDTVRRLACDASIVHLFEDAHGNPLDVGRKTRAISPALRCALEARDQGCRFPGCTHRRSVHAHHIKHWADGGETKLINLVQLCPYHHRLVHEGGFEVSVGVEGHLCFTRPGGQEIRARPPPLESHGWDALEQQNRTHGLRIDAHTCVPKWQGETMDYAMAVEGLLVSDGRLNAG